MRLELTLYINQPRLEEGTAQEQPDEDPPTLNSPQHPPSPTSIHNDDTETLAVPQLPSPPSPVDIDEGREPTPSLQLPGGSPDPLDIITSGEDDVESEPSQLPECERSPQSPISPPSLENSGPTASSEPKYLDLEGPSEVAEAEYAPDPLENLELSEIVESSESSDEPAGSPISHPLEDKMSTHHSSPIPANDEVSSQRSRSEPCEIAQPTEPPSPLEDKTETLATSTPRTATHVSEPQGDSGTPHWVFFIVQRLNSFLSIEPPKVLEMKEDMSVDDSQNVGTQPGQGDVMDVEVEQGESLQAASPVTELSRRDRKLRALHLHSILTVPDKRKVSEAASIFSDSIRDRKKVREDSQPVDEDEPGMHGS